MSKFDKESHYFSGQGVVMLGVKNAAGMNAYYESVGNVSSLKVNITTAVQEHKGSQDGQRAVDKRIQTETKANVTMILDSWIGANIAKALRGLNTQFAAALASTESLFGYLGKVVPLQRILLSNVVITAGVTPLTQFVNDATPWDVKVNADGGSFMLNDGVNTNNLGTLITAVAVGATTVLTAANGATVGSTVLVKGLTGADAAFLNDKRWTVTAATPLAVTIAAVTTAKAITIGAGSKVLDAGPFSVTATYDSESQVQIEALTQPLSEISVRFEGLNTADDNSPVTVELFKFSIDPLKELALISDTFGSFQLEGSLLADGSRTSGSKYFNVKKKQ
jgi:hypothetical protein